MSVPGVVPLARRGSCRDRKLAPSLQRGTSAQQPRVLDPTRVQAAASTPSQPSRLTGMNGSKIPGQVTPNDLLAQAATSQTITNNSTTDTEILLADLFIPTPMMQ